MKKNFKIKFNKNKFKYDMICLGLHGIVFVILYAGFRYGSSIVNIIINTMYLKYIMIIILLLTIIIGRYFSDLL